MKKNKFFIPTLSAIVVAVVGFAAFETLGSHVAGYVSAEDVLLAENVEALSAGGDDPGEDPRRKKNAALSSGSCGWKTDIYRVTVKLTRTNRLVTMDLGKTKTGEWCLLTGSVDFSLPGGIVDYTSIGTKVIIVGDYAYCESSLADWWHNNVCDRCAQKTCADKATGSHCFSDVNKPQDAI
mgnify:CR=1 FL=1